MARQTCVFAAGVAFGVASIGFAQSPLDYGIEFVTVRAPGNPPMLIFNFDAPDAYGRGGVPYEFRIGRYEVTTAQWMEFANVVYAVPTGTRSPFLARSGPAFWGAVNDLAYTGPGRRWKLADLPNAAMMPVFGLSPRECALFCNWLHNGKSGDPASILTGAYDSSTWGMGPQGSMTDQIPHLPGARFWIPTVDEMMKACHYDPNRFGPGVGGWWTQKNGRNEPSVAGPPGVGQTSAGYQVPNSQGGEYYISLGAYADQKSPWGLFDTSGATREYMEDGFPVSLPSERGVYGLPAGIYAGPLIDSVWGIGSAGPDHDGNEFGFRLASPAYCPADLDNDGSVANGVVSDAAVTIDDLLSFLVAFENGTLLADLDDGTATNTTDHAVTVEDLLYFLVRFEGGC